MISLVHIFLQAQFSLVSYLRIYMPSQFGFIFAHLHAFTQFSFIFTYLHAFTQFSFIFACQYKF